MNTFIFFNHSSTLIYFALSLTKRFSKVGFKGNFSMRNLPQNERSDVRRQPVTYRSKVGVLSFICVVIQSNKVESRLHLITATTKHVIPADALSAHLIAPAGRQERETVRTRGEGKKLKWSEQQRKEMCHTRDTTEV